MAAQADLFAAAPPPAPRTIGAARARNKSPAELPIPPRIPAWEAILRRTPGAANVTVLCTTLWTGICLETVCTPDQGLIGLMQDGKIHPFRADTMQGRVVFATIEMARAWHFKRELIPIHPAGTHSVRFHFGMAPGGKPLTFPEPFQEWPDGAPF